MNAPAGAAPPQHACGPARRPGRPRERRADRAIVDAALEIFADEGYHALTIEAVAARAGVGKTTIYRRWPGKKELVIDALATLNDDLPTLAPATTRDRLLAAMRHMASRDSGTLAGRIMPRMMTYSVSHPDLYDEYFDRVIMPRRRRLQDVLRDGIARGELRADLDIDLATMAIVGPVLLQIHSPGFRPRHEDVPAGLLDIVWPGISAEDGSGRRSD